MPVEVNHGTRVRPGTSSPYRMKQGSGTEVEKQPQRVAGGSGELPQFPTPGEFIKRFHEREPLSARVLEEIRND